MRVELTCKGVCSPRHSHEAVLLDRYVVVMGGAGYGQDNVDAVDVFDAVTCEWLPRHVHGGQLGRSLFSATNVGGTILLLGKCCCCFVVVVLLCELNKNFVHAGGYSRTLQKFSPMYKYASQQLTEGRKVEPAMVFDVGVRATGKIHNISLSLSPCSFSFFIYMYSVASSTLASFLASVLKSGLHSDLTFNIADQTFKVILHICSIFCYKYRYVSCIVLCCERVRRRCSTLSMPTPPALPNVWSRVRFQCCSTFCCFFAFLLMMMSIVL
jgi:hypothetical protein